MGQSFATIGRDLGRILLALSGMLLVSLIVALLWGEYYTVPGLLLSGLLVLAVGWPLTHRFRDAAEPGKLHGMTIAASGWLLVALFGALPFWFIAWTVALAPDWFVPEMTPTLAAFLSPTNAVFESMSGFTGTGLTMADREDVLPRTLQWWRSFTQWVGGVGVIVLTTAILSRAGSGSLTLYESEARTERIHPTIVSTVRTIWWIFLLFTFLSIVALWLAGMPIWHAINHAMTGLSTGGFSVTDDSIATYDSPQIDAVLIPIMLLGGIAFPVHYLVLRGDLRIIGRDAQTRWLFGIGGVLGLSLSALLWSEAAYVSAFEALRFGGFQFVSAMTCTGFQTATELDAWSPLAQLTVTFGMFVGAAAGSTCGGIKLIRFVTLIKGIGYRITGVFYPRTAVRHLRIDGRVLSDTEVSREFEEAAIVALLWLVFCALGMVGVLLILPDTPLENAFFEVMSAQSNVGLSTGITDVEMPELLKIVFVFNMWIGRLEIIPVLVLLRTTLLGLDLYR